MSISRYSKYKDSGVKWLGDVPEHWEIKRLGYFFEERREKVSDKDYPPLSVTKNGVVPQIETAAKTNDGDNRKRVCKGDFVINSRSDRKGSSGASSLDGSVSLINIVLKPRNLVLIDYIHHLFRSHSFQEEFYRFGKGIVADLWSTNYSEMRNIIITIPPLSEQQVIAAFLDRETAKIDALVEEQEKLIHLLKEKRQAVISRAVTKGLDPNVTMKDSGVEWIGETPTHWSILPIKYLVSIGNGSTPNKDEGRYWENGTFPWLTSGCVNHDEVESAEQYVTEAALRECHLPIITPPAVLVGITGQGKTRGMVTTLKIKATINQHIAFLKPTSESVRVEFLRRFLEASYEWLRFDSEGGGSTKGAITCEQLANTKITLLPLAEQESILDFIRLQTEWINQLQLEVQRSIDLLKERRSVLISAAVTGKIDVRRLVAEEVTV